MAEPNNMHQWMKIPAGKTIAETAIDNCWLVYEGSEVVKQDAWIPVGVELPEYGKDVLCVVENCYESGCVVMRRCKGNSGDAWEIVCDMFETEPSSRSVAGSVTHWLPMPMRPGG